MPLVRRRLVVQDGVVAPVGEFVLLLVALVLPLGDHERRLGRQRNRLRDRRLREVVHALRVAREPDETPIPALAVDHDLVADAADDRHDGAALPCVFRENLLAAGELEPAHLPVVELALAHPRHTRRNHRRVVHALDVDRAVRQHHELARHAHPLVVVGDDDLLGPLEPVVVDLARFRPIDRGGARPRRLERLLADRLGDERAAPIGAVRLLIVGVRDHRREVRDRADREYLVEAAVALVLREHAPPTAAADHRISTAGVVDRIRSALVFDAADDVLPALRFLHAAVVAAALGRHHDPGAVLAKIVDDLIDELRKLVDFEADAALALVLARVLVPLLARDEGELLVLHRLVAVVLVAREPVVVPLAGALEDFLGFVAGRNLELFRFGLRQDVGLSLAPLLTRIVLGQSRIVAVECD